MTVWNNTGKTIKFYCAPYNKETKTFSDVLEEHIVPPKAGIDEVEFPRQAQQLATILFDYAKGLRNGADVDKM